MRRSLNIARRVDIGESPLPSDVLVSDKHHYLKDRPVRIALSCTTHYAEAQV